MDIQLSEKAKNGSVFISENGITLAEMTWITEDNQYIIVEHTVVSDALKGQGVGRKLLDKVIQYARDRKLKIKPLCPFVKSVFDKVPEYGDVLYH